MDHIILGSIVIDQNYFEYIIKKHETLFDNPPLRIYINRIEHEITFVIKSGYYQVLSL